MSNGSKQETYAEKRHRLMHGKGLCHAHQLLYGGVQVCGNRESPGGIKLCSEHVKMFLNRLKPAEDVWVGRRELARLRDASALLDSINRDERPLHDRIAELEREVRELKALPPRRRRQHGRPIDGHVYFLHSDNLVKIGWASDLDARLKAYSPGARLLAVMPGTRQDEGRMHKKFADLKTNRREWFTYHPRVMEEVERIVREHGDPPRDLNEPMQATRIVGPRLNRPTQRRARSLGR